MCSVGVCECRVLFCSGHRVPRYSSILWGVCIPSSCSSYDLEDELSSHLSRFGVEVKVHNTMCTVKNIQAAFSFGKSLAIAFFLALTLALTAGTLFDDGAEGSSASKKILNAFSLRRNWKKLVDTPETSARVKGVDAIRGVNAFALLIVHKSMAMAHNPYVNKVHLSEVFGMPWAVLGRSAVVYTDSFLYLSGFLNAKNLLQEVERSGTVDVKRRLLARWFRLFPLFLSIMLFCTYILPEVNSGPQWNLVVGEHSRVCQKNMWKSFLFIHNYFGFENMLGMDMQLYVASIPLILLLRRYAKIGWLAVAALAVGSAALRYLSVYWHAISLFVYYGIPAQKLLDAARYCYILPTHRATIYLMGVAMAYFFNSKKSKFSLSTNERHVYSRFLTFTGSMDVLRASCAFLCLFTLVSPWWMGLPDYRYEHFYSAIFATFSPVAWGVFLAMIHWVICNGYAGKLDSFLESWPFRFFNKIAYGVYLTQFPLFFYNVGVRRNPGFYSPFSLLSIPELAVVLGISTLTTVAIEMPFVEVHRVLFDKSQSKLKEK
ncbi:Nose resistant to fluoxetine protein 6 [Eumeta japonica]|uniref:Nose resistant to fluoxetine protein 6 n=1 Tax=Eumeta variegata TaxID=151549 RepID=A0A4C1WA62_EUMVA|nr:Nose resistant to fluoxetine protein 6 [Eumeta japonica]